MGSGDHNNLFPINFFTSSGATEATMKEQEDLITQLKMRLDNLELMNKDLMKYKDHADGMTIVSLPETFHYTPGCLRIEHYIAVI